MAQWGAVEYTVWGTTVVVFVSIWSSFRDFLRAKCIAGSLGNVCHKLRNTLSGFMTPPVNVDLFPDFGLLSTMVELTSRLTINIDLSGRGGGGCSVIFWQTLSGWHVAVSLTGRLCPWLKVAEYSSFRRTFFSRYLLGSRRKRSENPGNYWKGFKKALLW